jgi:hypothetical protein
MDHARAVEVQDPAATTRLGEVSGKVLLLIWEGDQRRQTGVETNLEASAGSDTPGRKGK